MLDKIVKMQFSGVRINKITGLLQCTVFEKLWYLLYRE